MLKDCKIKKNQYVLKLFQSGDQMKLRVTLMSGLRTAGIEDEEEKESGKGSSSADEKLAESIMRTRSKIFELAYCNPWEWFFTGTLDASKYDRENLEKYHADFTLFIRKYNRRHGLHIKFLMIPEKHADGKSWHMHGFLMGLPEDHLHRFVLGDRMGLAISKKVLEGEAVYNWEAYQAKFGFCDLERIKNKEAVSNYVRKYISKELGKSVQQIGAHLYYRSRGLAEAVKLGSCAGIDGVEMFGDPSYQGEFTTSWWVDATPELLDSLSEQINLEYDLESDRQKSAFAANVSRLK